MDIRKWFTSPKTAKELSKKVEPSKSKEVVKVSKKRKILSDSESDNEPEVAKTKTNLPKSKSKTKEHRKNSSSPKKKSKLILSSDEDNVIDSDFDSPKVRSKEQKKSLRNIQSKSKESSLKVVSVTDFFGSAVIERTKKIPRETKAKNDTKLELKHDDKDFEKTLLQLEEKVEEETNGTIEKPSFIKTKRRHLSSDIEIDPSPKKEKVVTTPNKTKTPKKKTPVAHIESSESINKEELILPARSSPRKNSSSTNESSATTVKPSPKKKEPIRNIKSSPIKKSTPASKKIKKLSSNIEFEPPPKPTTTKKEVIKESPVSKVKKKPTGNAANYMSYLHRDGPRALGSKEIPEGEEGCLEGMSFIVTGVLESITRDETKELIEKHGGKLVNTLSKNTTYVVVGRDAGPAKLEKAEKLNTKQLTEDQLFELVKNTPGKGPLKKKTIKKETNESYLDKDVFTEDISLNKKSTLDENLKMTEDKRSSDKLISVEMWVDKYKPKSLKQLIGQQDDKSNAKKLLRWLIHWSQNTKNKKPAVAGRWNTTGDGAGFKAALLSGSPGVGKTTTAQLVCKEAGFDYFELNASDTRSKKSLQQIVSELVYNQSLANCFKGDAKGSVSRNHVIIMDEVDGMAGNEDRGGMQELIGFIKVSKIPIICICNDRNHTKIRSLSNYCFDLRFLRPRVEQIKGAMMSIAFKEGLKLTPNILQDVIIGANQDIRQVLHNLSMWSAKEKNLSAEQIKKDVGQGTKHIKMSPFDVLRDVFTIGLNSKSTINDKASLFFHDYSIASLFVQENYVNVLPAAAANDKAKHMRLLSECADSICSGDIIEKQIRSQGSWNLLPVQAIFASVVPGELLTGNLKQMVNFPAWLGKNSNRNHMDRILQELQMHMRMRITGNKTDVAMDYLPLLRHALTKPLLEKETEGVQDVLKVMDNYCLLREDFDSIIDLSLWSNQTDPRSKISAKVKSAFTRAYNKECSKNPYAVSSISKKKKGSVKSDLLGDEDDDIEESENEDNDKLENDAMIKVKKPTKTNTTASSKKATSMPSNKKSRAN